MSDTTTQYGLDILTGINRRLRDVYAGQALETYQGRNRVARRRAKNKVARKSRARNRHA